MGDIALSKSHTDATERPHTNRSWPEIILQVSTAAIEKLRAERDAAIEERDTWKSAAKRAGVCMTCATGTMEPCTDCLGTGWEGGAPAGYVEQEMLKEARRNALEEAATWHDAKVSQYVDSAYKQNDFGNIEDMRKARAHEGYAKAIRDLAEKGHPCT